MANKAISELPQAQNVNNQDLFVLEQSGIAKKLTAETFITEQGIIDALAEALDGHGGIQSVTLSSVSGRIRTYLITFTDGSATTFQVYDGTSIDRIVKTSTAGLTDTYTVFMNDGSTTFFTVTNGADGTVSEAMLNDALKNKAPVITETTESSAIANFTDGADDMPIQSLVAEIEPIQDLTYGDPYPAGSGKNLLNVPDSVQTVNGVTATVKDGVATLSGTASSRAVIYLARGGINIPAGSYKFNGSQSTLPASCYLNFNSGTGASVSEAGNALDVALNLDTDTSGDSNSYVRIDIAEGTNTNNLVFKPMIRLATETDAAFAPYSNICPISGHTEVTVTRTGKNLLNTAIVYSGLPALTVGASENSITSSSRYGYSGRIPAELPMILSAKSNNTTNFDWVRVIRYVDGIVVQNLGGFEDISTTKTLAIPALDNSYIKVVYGAKANGTIGVTVPGDVQVELGSTATTYEPYQGTTVNVDWTSEAGTVYGGTIDVATGLLTVDRAIVDMGTLTWSVTGDRFTVSQKLVPNPLSKVAWDANNPMAICSMYKYGNIGNGNGVDKAIGFYTGYLFARDTAYSTAADFKAAVAGQTLCYELATPQTYQLTPQQLLTTLLGTNNVWADTGNTTVTYPADTKMFIEKLTMPTEDDLVANQAITSGKYFMRCT